MNVRPLVVFATAIAAASWLPSAAMAARVSGSMTMNRTSNLAASASWSVGGSMLGARAESAVAGIPFNNLLHDSDSRYVHANLTGAAQAAQSGSCDDIGGVYTNSIEGVADTSAVVRLDITLNQLTGRGYATAGIAQDPYGYSIDDAFQSGNALWHRVSNCYGNDENTNAHIPVVGGSGPYLFDSSVMENTLYVKWPMTRSSGRWHVSGSRVVNDRFGFHNTTVTMNMTVSGTAVSMHALCHSPTPRELYGAKTLTGAKQVMSRAGFPHVIVTSPRHTKAARRGHYYVSNMIGNGNPIKCGWGGLKLTRSLGW